VISHTLLLNVDFPANLQQFLLEIFTVVNFEFLNVEGLTEWLMSFSTVEDAANLFTEAGIATNSFIVYVGFDAYVLILVLLGLTILKVTLYLYTKMPCF